MKIIFLFKKVNWIHDTRNYLESNWIQSRRVDFLIPTLWWDTVDRMLSVYGKWCKWLRDFNWKKLYLTVIELIFSCTLLITAVSINKYYKQIIIIYTTLAVLHCRRATSIRVLFFFLFKVKKIFTYYLSTINTTLRDNFSTNIFHGKSFRWYDCMDENRNRWWYKNNKRFCVFLQLIRVYYKHRNMIKYIFFPYWKLDLTRYCYRRS